MPGHDETGLGESSKPLTEQIIKERRDFIPTNAEWAAKHRRQIVRSTTVAGAIFYTVPDNVNFFLSVVILAGTGTGEVSVSTDEFEEGMSLSTIKLGTGSPQALSSETTSVSFIMPLKFNSGRKIGFNELNASGKCTIFGWEEDKE